MRREELYNISYLLFLNLEIIAVLLLILNMFNIINLDVFLNKNVIIGLFVVSTTLSIFYKNKLNNFRNKQSSIIESIFDTSPYFFLSILIILAVNQFLKVQFLTQSNFTLSVIAIAFGFLAFSNNKDRVEQELEDEKQREEQEEHQRYSEFAHKFPRISRIWGLRNIVRWMYKEGLSNLILLTLILLIFVLVKAPYMSLDFSGDHYTKYSSYVEPAANMLKNSPLWNQDNYLSNPFKKDSDQITFGNYPVMEWGLLYTYKLFPNNSIELNTRIFMCLLGFLILVSAYIFLKKFFTKKQLFFILFLISINFVFQFFTYVTVEDVFVILAMFISLIFLVGGLDKRKTKLLFLSGVIAGIGINIKYSALIFYLPIFLIFFFFYKKIDSHERLSYFFIIFPNFILETIFFRVSLRYMPINPFIFSLIFIVIILLHLFIYFNIKKINNILINKLKNISVNFVYLFILILTISSFFILLEVNWVYSLIKDFLTDKYLILNFSMYSKILDGIRKNISPLIYSFGLIFMIISLFIKNGKIRIVNYSFLISSLIYFILLSKVIYFHSYYTHIIMITFILFFSNIILIAKSYNKKLVRLLVLVLLSTYILSTSLPLINSGLSIQARYLNETSTFLKENLNENEFFIRNALTYLSFYSERKSFEEQDVFVNNPNLPPEFIDAINSDINISELMKNYGIKYYVTLGEEKFDKSGFNYLLSSPEDRLAINKQSFRTRIILCKEYNLCSLDYSEKTNLFDLKIRPYLILEKKIGNFYIYKFY